MSRPVKWLGVGVAGAVMAGCALFTPLPKPAGLSERLSAFPTRGLPLDKPVTIRWNDRQVPFIEAEDDGDAAFALGLVHAHLRLGQMSLARMIARGRLSEMVGPLAVDIDRGIRILSFARRAGSERLMDPETRRWVRRFVDGVNHYQDGLEELPHEFRVMGLEREPWTVADVLTVGRLAGVDVNWLVWARLMPLRRRGDWPELWARLVRNGSASLPSIGADGNAGPAEWLAGVSRSGSNSFALAPGRTATGGAVMASDPHLGIMLPNLWLIVGLKSPSHHAVGLMGPGLPVFAIGRNPDIAWGGTNMRAASSDLYDVSGLPEGEIAVRREPLGVRWWFDDEAVVRETPHGPILSDVPFLADANLPTTALRWTGHQASDEIGAMLAAGRARDFGEFRAAFRRFALPAQNMLYADAAGNIGQIMAARLPDRGGPPDDMLGPPPDGDDPWERMRGVDDLPFSLNPEAGYLVSANNRPAAAGNPVGYFFSPDDRVRRMAEMIEASSPLGLDEAKAMQRDVHMSSAARLRDLFVDRLDAAGMADGAEAGAAEAVRRMREWDGRYDRGSVGAVSFEQFRFGFTRAFYARLLGEEDGETFAGLGRIASLLAEDVEAADDAVLRGALAAGLEAAAENLDEFRSWGDMHRLSLAHPLGRVPVIGGRYRFGEHGVGGSSDTLMKTAHGTSAGSHRVAYGSNARHVSDLSDPDANYFVLLGGQDGWLNSSTFLDQWPLWRDGGYIRMPLTPEAVAAAFPIELRLGR